MYNPIKELNLDLEQIAGNIILAVLVFCTVVCFAHGQALLGAPLVIATGAVAYRYQRTRLRTWFGKLRSAAEERVKAFL